MAKKVEFLVTLELTNIVERPDNWSSDMARAEILEAIKVALAHSSLDKCDLKNYKVFVHEGAQV